MILDDKVTFTNPKYYIIDTVDGVEKKGIQTECNGDHISFPCEDTNPYYNEIIRQVNDGEITIADAD